MSIILESLNIKEIYFEGRVYNQEYVMTQADDLVNYIKLQNLNDSPFIHLYAENHIKTVIAFIAILKLKKICVIIEPHLRELEISMRYNDTFPLCSMKIDKSKTSFSFNKEIIIETNPFNSIINSDLSDVVMMLYTASEDGVPKAAMLTVENLLANVDVSNSVGIVYPNSKVTAILPFSHIYGFINGFLHPALSGIPFSILEIPDIRSVGKVFKEIELNKITIIHAVPLVYFFYTRMQNINELLKYCDFFFCGGVSLAKRVFDDFLVKTGKSIFEGYGLTEGTGTCSTHRNGMIVKQGSIGIPNKFTEFKIVNSNEELSIQKVGEIVLKGKNIMKGYYNHEDYTDKVLKDGWFYTGDLGRKDEEGYFYFEGLKKNMFNAAGTNIYPEELKNLMSKSGLITRVEIDCKVNEVLGDSIIANVELKKNTPENQKLLRTWCDSNISYLKIPKAWNFL